VSFLWQIFALWPQKKPVQIVQTWLFWGKKEAKVTIFGGKKSHIEPFRQMSYYWSPELGRILKR
jgi:hypothetical protein